MPDRHIRALREKLDCLLDSTRKLEGEIARALKTSSEASDDKPAKEVNRRVAKGPRRKSRKKMY